MKHKSHPIFLTILLITTLAAAGCGEASSMEPSKTSEIVLTEIDEGRTIEIQKGETLVVRLGGNPTTGYTWAVKDLDHIVLEQVGEVAFESVDTPPGLTGAGGTLVLTFEANHSGTVVLTLIYHRPWEVDVVPIDTFTVTVTVK